MQKKYLFLLFVISSITTKAQHEGTMHFMSGLPQIVYYNPAFVPKYKFSIGLPVSSTYFQYSNNGFSLNSFLIEENGNTDANLNKLADVLKEKNYITLASSTELFRMGLKVNPRIYFTYSLQAKTFTRLMIPKGLINIFANGTSAYINNTTTISPGLEALSYIESAWSLSYRASKRLTVGGAVKLLKGIVNASTDQSAVTLSLDDNYAITAAANINAKTSGIQNADDLDFEKDYKNYLKNNGFAFDVGATYHLFDRLTIGLSLVDVGGITWTNDTYGYTMDPEKAKYTFNGIDLNKMLDGDDDYFDSVSDSIETNFEFKEGGIGNYRTPIPGKVYLTANYELKRNLTAGAVFYAEKFRGRFSPAFSASLHKELGRRAGISLSYAITNRSYNNIGFGANLNFAPLQLYFVADNIIRLPLTTIDGNADLSTFVNSTKFFNVRAGLNFVFGRIKEQEKLPDSQ